MKKNSHSRYSAGGHDSGGVGMKGVKGKHVELPLQGPLTDGTVSGDMDLINPKTVRAALGKGCYERGTKMHCKRPKHNKRPKLAGDTGPVLDRTLDQGDYHGS